MTSARRQPKDRSARFDRYPYEKMLDRAARKAVITVTAAENALRSMRESMVADLLGKGRTWIPNFGTFKLRTRKGTKIRDFQGKTVVIPDRMSVKFRPSNSLRARLAKWK